MPSDSAQSIVAFVVRVIRESPNGIVIGAVLGNLIKGEFPQFSPLAFGCSNLRQFITQFGPLLVTAESRPGTDVLYSVNGDSSQTGIPVEPTDGAEEHGDSGMQEHARVVIGKPTNGRVYAPSVWSTFCSPSGAFHLFGNTSTGELCAVSSDVGSPGDEWVQIPSLSGEILKSIAKDFVSELKDGERGACEQSFESERWWIQLSAVLKQTGLRSKFQLYRQRIIERRLVTELSRLGIPCGSSRGDDYKDESLLGKGSDPSVSEGDSRQGMPIMADATGIRPVRSTIAGSMKSASSPSMRAGALTDLPETVLRRTVAAAVQKMSVQELRELRIPVGYIFDILFRG
jgi:hypothetical protein